MKVTQWTDDPPPSGVLIKISLNVLRKTIKVFCTCLWLLVPRVMLGGALSSQNQSSAELKKGEEIDCHVLVETA